MVLLNLHNIDSVTIIVCL